MSPYNIYAYQPHFGFSNNLMIILTSSLYGLVATLYLLSKHFNPTVEKIMKRIAFLLATDFCYTLVVFLSPSILTATYLELNEGVLLDWSLPWSKIILLFSWLMIAFAFLYSIYSATLISDIGTFLHKDKKLSHYMPIIFTIRLALIATLLFLYHKNESVPVYFIIIAQVSYILFVIIGRPHRLTYDLFRSLCIEIGLLIILLMRVMEIKALAEKTWPHSDGFPAVAYLEYIIYVTAIIVTIISMVYHFYLNFKNRKVGYDQDL